VLRGGGAFFDIGANWGHFVLFAATCPGFHGPIHAFEAAPASRRNLEALVRAADLAGRVICHPFGLSDHDGALPLVRGRHSALGRLDARARAPAVPVRRLDGLDLPPPAVIKLDVEGHEHEILRGASAILRHARPVIVFENWCSGRDPRRALAPLWLLADLGYDLFHLAWENSEGNHVFLTRAPPATEMAPLALVPLRLAERTAWPIALNLVAWPQEGGAALRRRCATAESQEETE
jgi:FkbM family methyltransferase